MKARQEEERIAHEKELAEREKAEEVTEVTKVSE